MLHWLCSARLISTEGGLLKKYYVESEKDATSLVDSVRRSAASGVSTSAGALEAEVASIIDAVRQKGDIALYEFTKHFDGVDLSDRGFEVSPAALEAALQEIPHSAVTALARAVDQVRAYFKEQYAAVASEFHFQRGGIDVRFVVRPVESAGIYVPGGRYRYPSSVIMTVVPAVVAGVRSVTLCTPPTPRGGLDPLVGAAARLAGAHRVFTLGGVQAIAAMAYGTETIPQVDVVVGPGNAYVACAKRMVFGQVGIEAVAGPSELVVVADDYAPWDLVATDLAAQAEHGPGGLAIAVVFSEKAAEALNKAVTEEVAKDSRDQLRKTMQAGGAIAVCRDEECALRVVLAAAPEHVQVMMREPARCERFADRINCAGVVFLGSSTPAPYGDYIAGPSHVLPTGGSAKFASGLGVYSFLRYQNYVVNSGISEELEQAAFELASVEGMVAHARSIQRRRSRGEVPFQAPGGAAAAIEDPS